MRPPVMDEVTARDAADELDRLLTETRDANRALVSAEAHLATCKRNAERASKRYQRQALWIRADELRRKLYEVEAQAESIKMD